MRWGGPTSYPTFMPVGRCREHAVPVDQAGRLALRRHAQPAGRPLAQGHPRRKGEIRTQWHHVTDLAPTVMEAAGLPFPKSVNGAKQKPFEGVSLIYSFDDPKAARSTHDAVLRDVRQPRHLPRGLGGRRQAPDSVGGGAGWAARSGQVGAVPRHGGLQPGERPGRGEP